MSTCRSAPHLRCRSSLGPRSGRVVPLGTSRPCRFQPRPEAFLPHGTPGSFETFDAEARPPAPSAPKVGTAQMGCSCTTKFTYSKNISVSVKPAFQGLLGVAVAAREPKPSAWPDVDKASEGHFPNRCLWHSRRFNLIGPTYGVYKRHAETHSGTACI
jgi:hypothetical protein